MNKLLKSLLYIGVAVLAIFLGFLLQETKNSNATKPVAQNVPVTNDGAGLILATTLPDLQGKNQSISQWKIFGQLGVSLVEEKCRNLLNSRMNFVTRDYSLLE